MTPGLRPSNKLALWMPVVKVSSTSSRVSSMHCREESCHPEENRARGEKREYRRARDRRGT